MRRSRRARRPPAVRCSSDSDSDSSSAAAPPTSPTKTFCQQNADDLLAPLSALFRLTSMLPISPPRARCNGL